WGRDDTPWYGSVRLFRQDRPGEWAGVFGRMAVELGRLAAGSGRCASVSVEVNPGELLDRLTILRIKAERIEDEAKLAHVRAELRAVEGAAAALVCRAQAAPLIQELRGVNE